MWFCVCVVYIILVTIWALQSEGVEFFQLMWTLIDWSVIELQSIKLWMSNTWGNNSVKDEKYSKQQALKTDLKEEFEGHFKAGIDIGKTTGINVQPNVHEKDFFHFSGIIMLVSFSIPFWNYFKQFEWKKHAGDLPRIQKS